MRLCMYILYPQSSRQRRRGGYASGTRGTPELREVLDALDAFDFSGYEELVYCGYGEPTCALDILTASAKYAKEKYGIRVRVNTNGLANLYYGRDVVPNWQRWRTVSPSA